MTSNFAWDTQTSRVNSQLKYYAPPLMPMKDRDWMALVELFSRKDGDEIETDIINKLLTMVPEPLCWEEDPYEFLHEYL